MLKGIKIDDLKPGMIIGRDVITNDNKVLLKAGATVDEKTQDTLKEASVFSVEISVEEEPAAPAAPELPAESTAPEKDILLDEKFANVYDEAYSCVGAMYEKLKLRGELDMDLLNKVITGKLFRTVGDGAKAVSLIHNVSRKGKYLIHHAVGASILADLMARWLGYSPVERRDLILAALFLDVGKIRISDDIWNKAGSLSTIEYGIVKNHPKFSYEIMSKTQLGTNANVMDGIVQHHERLDGSGYPYQLYDAQISSYGRILGIIDLYDAMAADRSYAKRNSPFDIFAVINDNVLAGRFDTEYGVLFMRKVCHALNGNWVRINDGSAGRIVYIDEGRVTSLPVVQTTDGDFLDLNKEKEKRIAYILKADEVAALEA